jgi:hypothetical protein
MLNDVQEGKITHLCEPSGYLWGDPASLPSRQTHIPAFLQCSLAVRD